MNFHAGWQVANEITKPQVVINSNYSSTSVLQWISSHGCAPFTTGVPWLSDDYWRRQIDGVGPSWRSSLQKHCNLKLKFVTGSRK